MAWIPYLKKGDEGVTWRADRITGSYEEDVIEYNVPTAWLEVMLARLAF